GLPFDTFRPASSGFVPPVYASERTAWEGPLPERPDYIVHVETAGHAGKPVFFGIAGPWTRSSRSVAAPPSLFTRVINTVASVVMPGLMLLGVVFARI